MKKGSLFTPKKGLFYGYITPVLTITLFTVLLGVSVFSLIYRSGSNTASIVEGDLHLLADVFKQIDADCRILNFDYTLNRINFLNVKEFSGSEVGPMNLSYPKNWKGPYLPDNPTIQEIEYLMVATNKGYYITPGSGVRLPNGKVVGRDIVLNKEADIDAMMQLGGPLFYKGKVLAVKVDIGASTFERIIREDALPYNY